MARVEVRVRKDDVALLRRVAAAVTHPVRATEARALLLDNFHRAAD